MKDRPMRVLIDAHMLGEQEGGNETYVAGLIEGFGHLDLPERYILTLLHGPHYQPTVPQTQGLHFSRLNDGNNWSRVFATMPARCRELSADLVHVTYNASPFLKPPVVVTVHDVIFRIFPQYFSRRVRLLLSSLLPLTMLKARKIITISETSRDDIERYYPFTRGKIQVTPLAPGPIIDSEPDWRMSEELTGGSEFIVSVGTLQPRKNIARLIQAYIAARTRGSIATKLLIVGRAAWQHSEIYKIANQSEYSADIIFTGYVPDETLNALYHRCKAFIYPSLYEGFGLPVLEAMACGAPVITSNCSSMPEVAGDAAFLVNPYSVDDIRTAIEHVVNNEDLRHELHQRGRARANDFSWAKTAAMTLDIYRQTVTSRGRVLEL